jgi:hypothetical protein
VISQPLYVAIATLFLPIVLVLVAYDIRWLIRSVRAGQWPPWGIYSRLFAAVCCHAGVFILAAYGRTWPQAQLTYWLHMTLDPGLTFYAVGLYELYGRMLSGGERRAAQGRGKDRPDLGGRAAEPVQEDAAGQ